MGSFITVENISSVEFNRMQQTGWILVSVDNYVPQKFVYKFVRF